MKTTNNGIGILKLSVICGKFIIPKKWGSPMNQWGIIIITDTLFYFHSTPRPQLPHICESTWQNGCGETLIHENVGPT